MRVLIADDESIIRLGLKAMLREMGHEVLAAANGREALEMARNHPVDLAILDIKMPFTDGLQAAKTLARTSPLPIIMLTAYSDQELIDKATDLPIHGYLVKPVQKGDVAAAISVALKRFRDAQRLQEQATELEDQLESRRLIDQAKARLMATTALNEEDAYRTIQTVARQKQQTMRQVAEAILRQ
ncbi:MAG: response regulator [Chloroflexi bacterium]|nr:response regulator [Chloroflexota bacterium]MBP8059371.1 response regulator [Chloroflexota bacterium]